MYPATSSRAPATRVSSTRSRRMAKARALQDRRNQCGLARVHAKTGELIAGTESPGRYFVSTRPGRPSCSSIPPSARFTLRLAQDGTIYAAAVRARRRGRRSARRAVTAEPPRARHRRYRLRSRACRSSTAPSQRRERQSASRRGRRAVHARRDLSHPPDGLWDTVGHGDDRPTTSWSRTAAACSSARALKARSSDSRRTPRATLLARAAARQITALRANPPAESSARPAIPEGVRAVLDAGRAGHL